MEPPRLNYPIVSVGSPNVSARPLGAAQSSGGEPVPGFLGVIGQDEVRAGPADRGQDLQGRPSAVDPTVLRGGLDHGVLPAHAIRGEWKAGLLLRPADHV